MLSKQNQVFLIIHFTYIYIPVFTVQPTTSTSSVLF